MTESSVMPNDIAEPAPVEATAAPAIPTCPNCASIAFQKLPQGIRCVGCGLYWHPTDLEGTRFAYLSEHYTAAKSQR